MADDGRCLEAALFLFGEGRFSLDEDRGSLSAVLFRLEEGRCQRSTVRVREAAVRLLVDDDRRARSTAKAPVPEPLSVRETAPDIALFILLIVKDAFS
jgi:hypothetical protein